MNLKGNLTSKGLQGSIGKSRMQGILGTNPAAIPITVDNALSLSSTNPVQNKVITAAITNRLWSDEVKDALLQIVEKVAFIDEHGQDYYDALYDALYPPVGLDSIGAVFDSSATIYNTDTLDDLKQYLTVTAFYSDGTSETVTTYTLSGSMDAGTQTITVSYGGKTTTFTVTVAEWVTSISAVFTQGTNVVYYSDSLDTLRQYLVVTATYADMTSEAVNNYVLSGTLTIGETSTITVSYVEKTDAFTVNVSAVVPMTIIQGNSVYNFSGSTLLDISYNGKETKRCVCNPMQIKVPAGRYSVSLGSYSGATTFYYGGRKSIADGMDEADWNNVFGTSRTILNSPTGFVTGQQDINGVSGWHNSDAMYDVTENLPFLSINFKKGSAGTTAFTATDITNLSNQFSVTKVQT